MKRYFINQRGASNKFWNIETNERVQIITFGKADTQGRETIKVFKTVEECSIVTKKLISSKIKKGYVEIKENEVTPEKINLLGGRNRRIVFLEFNKKIR